MTIPTPQATKRLQREYKTISNSPPPYIAAHPSDHNILEWHYIITGPPGTPYVNGQYWGTLMFPPDYPFAPPAIRMHTPSGRFQPSARLCLSISDFHPKSFNPAWEVSTILIGLLSFMTSEEMTTGSVRASYEERKALATRSRWWNSTGGGSHAASTRPRAGGAGAIKAGDGGAKFRLEWPEIDSENWRLMKDEKIDISTGLPQTLHADAHGVCAPEAASLRKRPSTTTPKPPVPTGRRDAGQGWLSQNKYIVGASFLLGYILVTRVLGIDRL